MSQSYGGYAHAGAQQAAGYGAAYGAAAAPQYQQQQQQAYSNEGYQQYSAAQQQQVQQPYAAQQQHPGAENYSNGFAQQQDQPHQQQQYQQYQSPPQEPHVDIPADTSMRWSWSLYPTQRLDGARMVAPLGCIYAPLATSCTTLPYAPVACTVCGGILNPFCTLDTRSRTWGCPLCFTKNSMPVQYAQISETNLPGELHPTSSTVEYVVPAPQRRPPTFIFVVDTCIDTEEELQGLKEFLLLSLEKIPEYATAGFITYGTTVQVHEVTGATAYSRAVVFRGTQEMGEESLKAIMPSQHHFVAAMQSCRQNVVQLVNNLSRDLWPVMKDHRPLRCTGAALSVAASLLKLVAPNTGSSILAFISGVCTAGPGIVVDPSREKMIRGHADIRDNTATAGYWTASCSFYDSLMQRIVAQGHALNCFTASLDQLGVAEMKVCIQSSGGVVLNAESWLQEPFRISLHQFFARRDDGTLKMGLNAIMDVVTSPSWKVQGVIGQCVGTGKPSNCVAEYEIGLGGTCQWTTCMLDSTSSFAIYFDAASGAVKPEATSTMWRYVQVITRYEVGQESRIRVITQRHRQAPNPPTQDLIAAFDQEATAVLMARQAIHKTDSLPVFDVLRWLDRLVVRLVCRFGEYTKDQPGSLRLPPEFVYFPAFMFHLRRSGYLKVFNSSPDESAILRLQLLKSGVAESIVQIQPTLYSYRMDTAPQPVPLDSTAIQPDNILLLDTFFEVLIHHGATIAAWRKAGYADLDEYAYFKEFLEVPMADAQVLVGDRYPTPRLIDVCQDDPDARILYNRINPSRSYASAEAEAYGSHEGELVYTDDPSLQAFMQHLKKVAVSQ